ncbi:hypothetical protein QI554_34950 [Yinghuangia seranimata]|nr:hypothetical protein [Yinghuangia seranimata]MDI2131343.1 hypothetical protein [Yinghuangia seranimata]
MEDVLAQRRILHHQRLDPLDRHPQDPADSPHDPVEARALPRQHPDLAEELRRAVGGNHTLVRLAEPLDDVRTAREHHEEVVGRVARREQHFARLGVPLLPQPRELRELLPRKRRDRRPGRILSAYGVVHMLPSFAVGAAYAAPMPTISEATDSG